MQSFPHRYQVNAIGGADGTVAVSSPGLATLETTPPPEFDGPAGYWSPETLLTGALADCFVLSFRAVADASKFEWGQLAVEIDAVLDRVEKVTRFTRFTINARLTVPEGSNLGRAKTLLEKA